MNRKGMSSLCLVLFFLISWGLVGCAITPRGSHVYPGAPLPSQDVAFIWGIKGCYLKYIRGGNEFGTKCLAAGINLVELTPGSYTLGMMFSTPSGQYSTGVLETTVNAQAGGRYVVFPEIMEIKKMGANGKYTIDHTWKPILVSLNDYDEKDCDKKTKWSKDDWRDFGTCPSRKDIDKVVAWHFNGERPALTQFSPSDDPNTAQYYQNCPGTWWR